jgi:hypothetical protein
MKRLLGLCLSLTTLAGAEPIPASFFGMHIHNAATTTPWPAVPIAAWRLWDARVAWPQLEPQKGQWQFKLLDQLLALADEHHTEVLLTLGLTPTWASARPQEKSNYQPGNAAEPKDIKDWQEYVTAVVTHCKGRVHAYEIWNEPNLKGFWTGNTTQLLDLTREASQIIRSIDPQAIVVSPSATGDYGTGWLDEFLAGGGGQYVDVLGYHFYVMPNPPEAMTPLIQKVRHIMADHNMGDKPLWNTESGWAKPKPFPSDELGAAYLARTFVVNRAEGVSRFYWYAWDNHNWVSLQTTGADSKTPTPAGRAYGVIQGWLVGAQVGVCSENSDHTIACDLARAGEKQWIIWNTVGTGTFPLPLAWGAKSVTPLLGDPHAIEGSSLEVSQSPELVTTAKEK